MLHKFELNLPFQRQNSLNVRKTSNFSKSELQKFLHNVLCRDFFFCSGILFICLSNKLDGILYVRVHTHTHARFTLNEFWPLYWPRQSHLVRRQLKEWQIDVFLGSRRVQTPSVWETVSPPIRWYDWCWAKGTGISRIAKAALQFSENESSPPPLDTSHPASIVSLKKKQIKFQLLSVLSQVCWRMWLLKSCINTSLSLLPKQA